MGASIGAALIGGGLSYLGAKKQADAQEANAERAYQADLAAQQYYESQVQPGIDAAKAAFASGAPAHYAREQAGAADYASGLGRYYAAQGIPEYERGRRLEDIGTSEAVRRSQLTPQQLAAEQVALAAHYRQPTQAGVSAIEQSYRAEDQARAARQARGGTLASSLAGQQAASSQAARGAAIGQFVTDQRQRELDRAVAAQARAQDVRGVAATQAYNVGQAAATRGVGFGDRAVAGGETAARLGIGAAYLPAKEYLGTVQSPTSGRPRITNVPQESTISPLTYGFGQGLQTYYDFNKQR